MPATRCRGPWRSTRKAPSRGGCSRGNCGGTGRTRRRSRAHPRTRRIDGARRPATSTGTTWGRTTVPPCRIGLDMQPAGRWRGTRHFPKLEGSPSRSRWGWLRSTWHLEGGSVLTGGDSRGLRATTGGTIRMKSIIRKGRRPDEKMAGDARRNTIPTDTTAPAPALTTDTMGDHTAVTDMGPTPPLPAGRPPTPRLASTVPSCRCWRSGESSSYVTDLG
mmetsp:Transcript_41372/g.81048  ORF Transcript_41372/g.81048 Transcript_41372/m.81048 type:complete len:219 (+) Transcript_41372:493-1149(+)